MSTHPYQGLPAHTRWTKAVSGLASPMVDPVVAFPFQITPEDRVATGGSCFAQNIARHLKTSGFNYFVVEDGHPIGNEALKAECNYGVYSARYANIYTSRQLAQLFRRVFEGWRPLEDAWQTEAGRYLDPLRPQIQPGGFASLEELKADRSQHLRAVRRMFTELDYFVFTLGLTEVWRDKRDGTVFPLCPGVAGGTFDDNTFEFVNLEVQDVVEDMAWFFASLRSVNPKAKVVLTVSPVPLAATAREDSHVLSSTTYSKSVLRVASEILARNHDYVAYFPSFEIITGNFNRGAYYASDLRNVTEEGVDHVMRLFFHHATISDRGVVPVAA